jgi:hypothetical protein
MILLPVSIEVVDSVLTNGSGNCLGEKQDEGGIAKS